MKSLQKYLQESVAINEATNWTFVKDYKGKDEGGVVLCYHATSYDKETKKAIPGFNYFYMMMLGTKTDKEAYMMFEKDKQAIGKQIHNGSRFDIAKPESEGYFTIKECRKHFLYKDILRVWQS